MAKANAGRILIMPKGTYDANATYELLDLVSYNNTSWLAKKTATGIEPSEANSEYWHKMAEGINQEFADRLGAVEEVASDASADADLAKDTLGYACKNLLNNTATTQTINGVTFTVNADGSVTANGTATANISFVLMGKTDILRDLSSFIGQKVILTGCPSGGSTSGYMLNFQGATNDGIGSYDLGNGAEVTLSDFTNYEYLNIYIRIVSGLVCDNLTFYPMLRKADIADSTYEPYHEPVSKHLEEVELHTDTLGYSCKNLLKNTATTQTVNGVTFTVNDDGSITANGTATDIIRNPQIADITLNAGERYILTGSVALQKRIILYYKDDYTKLNAEDKGEGVEFTVPITGVYRCYIWSNAGEVFNNETFYPMLRKASITDATYEPYREPVDARLLALEGGSVDASTVRYVSDEADENFDWIQVQDAEGNWINTQRAYTQRRDLYMTSANEGNFESYNGSLYAGATLVLPTVTCGDVMQMRIFANNNRMEYGCAISELIDLSRFKTLHLYHKSSSGIANSGEKVRLFITQLKETKMTAIAYIDLLPAYYTSREGDVEFDISAISGEYYIGIQVCANSEGGQVLTQTEISNFYLE